MDFEGLPGIEDYLESRAHGCPIDVSELDHIIEHIVAYCGLTKEQSKRILTIFFQVIRSLMLRGKIVDIRGFGSFFISSPSVNKNSFKIFPKFRSKRSLIRRLNNHENI
jgi:hypothetical protein